jgi:hypothetical protein
MRNESTDKPREIDDDVKQFLGLPPYSQQGINFYNMKFELECAERYGSDRWLDTVLYHKGG